MRTDIKDGEPKLDRIIIAAFGDPRNARCLVPPGLKSDLPLRIDLIAARRTAPWLGHNFRFDAAQMMPR